VDVVTEDPATRRLQARLSARAQWKAHRVLSHRYRDEYVALYQSIKAEMWAEQGWTYQPPERRL